MYLYEVKYPLAVAKKLTALIMLETNRLDKLTN